MVAGILPLCVYRLLRWQATRKAMHALQLHLEQAIAALQEFSDNLPGTADAEAVWTSSRAGFLSKL
jgi:hypothetical protein